MSLIHFFSLFRTAVLFRKQQNVKRPELQLKDDSMIGSLGLGKDVETKVEEKKKRGRKPSGRKSTDNTVAEHKKPLLL